MGLGLRIGFVVAVLAGGPAVRADIFQWEYINPVNPAQGKRQSMTRTPDGAGAVAGPGALLEGLDLTKAYLNGADLRDADLRNSDLSDATLVAANLAGAVASANFWGADLSSASLLGADARGSIFYYVNLSNTNFTNSLINGSSFFNPSGPTIDSAQLYSTASYQKKDLHGTDFGTNPMPNWDFSNQNMSGTRFFRSNLRGANFAGANLTAASLTGTGFVNTDLRSANFAGANLAKAQLEYLDLSDASLAGANLRGADIRYVNFSNVDFTSAEIVEAAVAGLSAAQFYSTASYRSHDLRGVGLMQANLRGFDLSGQDMTGANLSEAGLQGANLNDAKIGFSSLSKTRIGTVELYSTASYKAHDLRGIDWGFGNVAFDFSNQDLSESDFTFADVTQSSLVGANLTRAVLIYTRLVDVDLTDAIVNHANFERTVVRGFSAGQLYSTASYKAHDLRGIGLKENNLSGWNFSGQDLSGAQFGEEDIGMGSNSAILTNADFNDAIVSGTNLINTTSSGFTSAQLYSTASYKNHDLRGIDLQFNNLAGWNFAGQDLRGAKLDYADVTNVNFADAQVAEAGFVESGLTLAQLYSTASYKAKDLHGIDLANSDLEGANFARQNLAGASFHLAHLAGAEFSDAMIAGASFGDVTVNGFTAEQLYSTASYQSRDLHGIRLSNNDMRGWNFAGQNLARAMFEQSDLSGANLAGANLTGAFVFCDLAGANLAGAEVSEALFADLTPEQLYSTASYQRRDLHGVRFSLGAMRGWNLAGQNLHNAQFNNANLAGTDFTAADLRAAQDVDFTKTIRRNTILPEGEIARLQLNHGEELLIRDYGGDVPIVVSGACLLGPEGALGVLFSDKQWGSTISFQSGIAVELGGELRLAFADGADVSQLLGETFHLFDWDGVAPTGQFRIVSDFDWDTSRLYTMGQVTLIPEPGAMAFLLAGAVSLSRRRRDFRKS